MPTLSVGKVIAPIAKSLMKYLNIKHAQVKLEIDVMGVLSILSFIKVNIFLNILYSEFQKL